MLKKILIANRGEIAIRVMRTCRELGITTVAVYSELDRDAQHVQYADEAYALGGRTSAESYLNSEAIIDVITRSGADGVHPGYGFYSENADFARTVTEMGVAWIGPPPEAIEQMGDKISARQAAIAGGVPTVPGTTEPIEDPQQILDFGNEFGWPVAIKAAFGGGGRGMKVVHSADEAVAAFEAATREAVAYFGRAECYMERYLTRPRHVEVQVMCDTRGNAVWLGERDCSVQRRHQKLIEETPAPGLTEAEREAMGKAGVDAARACGYTNAGTVEMLYQDGEFFFLEMNTRLQVEHCVTEMVTQRDLVAEQIRVASGLPLSFTQDEIVRHGASIECRVNAENPAKKFMPAPGVLRALRPSSGPGVRWDGGYIAGDEISQYYDNLVGKLVVWAPTRDEAIARMVRAIDEFVIDGVPTTLPAQRAILLMDAFKNGTHSTRWLEEEVDPSEYSGEMSAPAPQAAPDGETPEPLQERTVPVEVDGKRYSVKVWLPEVGAVAAKPTRNAPRLKAPGAGGSSAGSGSVEAPMQGTIVKVLVEVGQEVAVGDGLVVLEAMKMENPINAETAGKVVAVAATVGTTVAAGEVLVTIE